MTILASTHAHEFGLIIPSITGVIWQHQCDGVCCHQIEQEGIFIPLEKFYFESEKKRDYEYFYRGKNIPFEYEDITYEELSKKESSLELTFHEAYEWIIFKGWKDEQDSFGEGFDQFIGKKMLLVYKNSD